MYDKFIEKWGRVREAILDNGNDNKRSMLNELDNYNVSRVRFTYEFRRRDNG